MIGQKRLMCLLITVLVTLISGAAFAGNQCYAADPKINVYVDGKEVIFDQPPVNKDGSTLVPLRAIFEAIGMTVEWDQTTKKISATNGNVTIGLQVGNASASVGNNEAGYIETVLDTAPQNINGRVLVPVRFIGEASGSDVVWDGTTKSINITSRPDRVFKGDKAFNTVRGDYTFDPSFNRIGYCIEGVTDSVGRALLDGFGKSVYGNVSWVGTFKNDELNGHITYTMENGDKLIGDYINDELADGSGKYVFANGSIYVGPVGADSLPNGIGTYTDINGNTTKAKFFNGKYSGIVDPTKPYDFYGNLLKDGDSVEFITIGMTSFIGTVTEVNGGNVKVEWYDLRNSFGQSILYTISSDEFNMTQSANGITFYTSQWIRADKLFLK